MFCLLNRIADTLRTTEGHKYFPQKQQALEYSSDSQPGVRVPPGVRTRKFRDTQKKLNNGGKRHTSTVLNVNIYVLSVYLIIVIIIIIIIIIIITLLLNLINGLFIYCYLLTPWSRVLLEKLTSKLCS